MRKIKTEWVTRGYYGRVIMRSDKDTDEIIDYKVLDANKHVVYTSKDRKEADDKLNELYLLSKEQE